MRLRSGLTVGAAVAALLAGAATSPAAAKPIDQDNFHDETSTVIEEFCGDLTVREDFVIDGTVLFNPHGRDGLAYYAEQVHFTQSWTNLANGKSLTHVSSTLSKDLKVTDNGDGTLTILVLATGSFKVYGPDGELLFKDPGQIRFELLIDHGGTPSDPSDDVELEFLGLVKGSTGRNDLQGRDFCEDIHTYIG